MPDSDVRTRRKELLVEQEQELNCVVCGIYEALAIAFREALPDMVENLRPNFRGWVFEPGWPGPRREGNHSGCQRLPRKLNPKFPAIEEYHRIGGVWPAGLFMTSVRMESKRVREIEHRIYERFWSLGATGLANMILQDALKAAQNDLKTGLANRPDQNDALSDPKRPEKVYFKKPTPGDATTASHNIRSSLLAARVHWLVKWIELENSRSLKRIKSHRLQVSAHNVERLIKPRELLAVNEEIDNISSSSWRVVPADILDLSGLINALIPYRQRLERNTPDVESLQSKSTEAIWIEKDPQSIADALNHWMATLNLLELLRATGKVNPRNDPDGDLVRTQADHNRCNRAVLEDVFPGLIKNSLLIRNYESERVVNILVYWYRSMLYVCGDDSANPPYQWTPREEWDQDSFAWLQKVERKLKQARYSPVENHSDTDSA